MSPRQRENATIQLGDQSLPQGRHRVQVKLTNSGDEGGPGEVENYGMKCQGGKNLQAREWSQKVNAEKRRLYCALKKKVSGLLRRKEGLDIV